MNASETVEELQCTVNALNGIQDLLANQVHHAQMNTDNLYFLLGLIADRQNSLIQTLITLV